MIKSVLWIACSGPVLLTLAAPFLPMAWVEPLKMPLATGRPVVPAPSIKHTVGDNNIVGSWRTTGTVIACDNVEDVVKYIDFASARDKRAFQNFLGPLIIAGECVRIAAGTKVLISEASTLGSTIRVRQHGEKAFRYVPRSMIEAIEE